MLYYDFEKAFTGIIPVHHSFEEQKCLFLNFSGLADSPVTVSDDDDDFQPASKTPTAGKKV